MYILRVYIFFGKRYTHMVTNTNMNALNDADEGFFGVI
jgi:hypothetical protein